MSSLDRARDLLAHNVLVDGHNDLPWAMRELNHYDMDAVDLAQRVDALQTDIVRLREGKVGAQFWSVYVPSTLTGLDGFHQTVEQIDFVHNLIERFPETFGYAETVEDVEREFASGRIASLLGAEGGQSIACSMPALRALHRLGVRYMTLTHNHNNPWADSATDVPVHNGLSDFGREVVREMNRVGMLVDLSHVSADTMRNALDITEAPVIMSHSSTRAVCDHVRNVPDDVLARLSGNGGVIMVTFVPDFVSEECRAWTVEVNETLVAKGVDLRDWYQVHEHYVEIENTNPKPLATIAQVADHVDHARQVAGLDHVGIGGDYDGCPDMPINLEHVGTYPELFAELLDRGWSEDDCAKIAGRNVLRALRDAEDVAHKLQVTRGPSRATI